MPKRSSLLKFAVIGFGWILVSPSLFCEPKAKVCVASLLFSENTDAKIKTAAIKILKKIGYSDAESRFDYFNQGPSGIRRCLEGNYEEVLLAAHASERISKHFSIVYNRKEIDGSISEQVLDSKLFQSIKFHSNLRQITLAFCEAEKVLKEYRVLARRASEEKIRIRFQPSWMTGTVLTEGRKRGLREISGFARILAEAAQDEAAPEIYCALRTNLVGIYEHGQSSCIRSHFEVKYRGYLSAGFKSATRWIKFSIGENKSSTKFSLVDLELGFGRSIGLGVSKPPFVSNRDTFGFSASLAPYIRIDPVVKK